MKMSLFKLRIKQPFFRPSPQCLRRWTSLNSYGAVVLCVYPRCWSTLGEPGYTQSVVSVRRCNRQLNRSNKTFRCRPGFGLGSSSCAWHVHARNAACTQPRHLREARTTSFQLLGARAKGFGSLPAMEATHHLNTSSSMAWGLGAWVWG